MKKAIVCALVLACCLAGFGYAGEGECYNQPIPKEYGRLVSVVGVSRTSCLFFFEANDGTIRIVRVQACDKTRYRVCKDSMNYTINRN